LFSSLFLRPAGEVRAGGALGKCFSKGTAISNKSEVLPELDRLLANAQKRKVPGKDVGPGNII
jgi:hypothetical protein